ncbi:PIN domain-containing protein [Streptosporangium sp. NBC_01495]|uniref:PIN domain-containing protein n=1 Tax=Streptosporangium sp. NBC_01495 TaxID=2903899 RepID=UPI002E2F85E6|nr:PIN domain-containing protein [Streptosporangium sp. NBC_01495]
MIGRVLDTTALIAFANGNSPYAQAVVWSRMANVSLLVIPAAALTEALAQLPDEAVQVLDVLLGLEVVVVDDLTTGSAPAVAEILKVAGPRAAEVLTAASAVQSARRRGGIPILTRDRFTLTALAPDAELDLIP